MANLPTEDRVRIWRGIMRWYSAPATQETLSGILKADLQAAVNAADAWADSAAASPTTARCRRHFATTPRPARRRYCWRWSSWRGTI